jgi:hypothetical protein
MKTSSVTLNWEGVWKLEDKEIPFDISDIEGIYMVVSGKVITGTGVLDRSSYKLLYIGEAEKIRSRIVKYEMLKKWKENCKDTLLLKIARCQIGSEKRKEVEHFLIYNAKPVFNEQGKNDISIEADIIEIINSGIKLPLKDRYVLDTY